jgi:hypothetical protein
MKPTPLRERLRTAWNTLRDHPGANVELTFGELPPALLVGLEALAEEHEVTLSEATYYALWDGVRLNAARRLLRQEPAERQWRSWILEKVLPEIDISD